VFGQERDQAAARLVNSALWLTVTGASAYEGFQLFAGIGGIRLAVVPAVGLLAVVGLVALQRGSLQTAGWVAAATVFSIACVSMLLGGGPSAPGATTLVVLVLLASMTLDPVPTLVWIGLSLAAIGVFAALEQYGVLPPAPIRSPIEMAAIIAYHIGAAAWLVLYSGGAIRRILGVLGLRSNELAASEERYAGLVEQSPDVIVALDHQGTVVECSPAIETLFGHRASDVIGRSFEQLGVLPADHLDRNLDTFHGLLTGERPQLTETQVLHQDGSVRWVEANVRVVRRDDGHLRIYLVIRDVTSRVESEAARSALEKQLSEARRLEALGRLAGGMAHDFNNLLLVMLANAELLQEDEELHDKALIEEIKIAGEAAADLTARLLAFAGRQVAPSGASDVGETLEHIDPLLRRLLPPNIRLTIAIAPGTPAVGVDAAQLEQVIVNLVMNAQQAMPEGGSIELGCSKADLVAADKERAFARVTVADTGAGMPDETLAHIFEPFFTRREGGTGLGLATVHGIVTHAGGSVDVNSTVGQGTRFDILLPASDVDPQESDSAPSAAPSLPPHARILLVDDEPAVLRAVKRILENEGAEVLVAEGPTAARDVLATDPRPIDVLLTDVLMPEASGPELANELHARRPEMKVLLMSGYTEDQLESSAIDRTHDFLRKPFSRAELTERIGAILDKRDEG
jgi:PAS domain S-box-containing protein